MVKSVHSIAWLRWAAAPAAVLASSVMVWHASSAAFTATTSNGPSNWSAGTVTLSDDDSGTAMFNVSGLKPADNGSKCIAVTYDGSLAANVKLYASAAGTLGSYLDLTVEQGTGGSSGSCSGFTPAATIYAGTLAGFASSASNYATGVGGFAPTGSAQTRTYRFTYTVQNNNAAQGASASGTFTWEAQNS
jgi:hypothetical protein